MNKEEFERKVSNLISVAQHWQMSADNYSSEDCANYILYQDLTKERELELLAEHDRLTAEVERLRWHYPNEGELPERDKQIFADVDHYLVVLNYCENDIWFTDDREGKPCQEHEITRWRYIE